MSWYCVAIYGIENGIKIQKWNIFLFGMFFCFSSALGYCTSCTIETTINYWHWTCSVLITFIFVFEISELFFPLFFSSRLFRLIRKFHRSQYGHSTFVYDVFLFSQCFFFFVLSYLHQSIFVFSIFSLSLSFSRGNTESVHAAESHQRDYVKWNHTLTGRMMCSLYVIRYICEVNWKFRNCNICATNFLINISRNSQFCGCTIEHCCQYELHTWQS